MWSAASPKPAEDMHSDDMTPHNATLCIISTTHVDPVARSVVAGPVCLGDDADALGLEAQGDDLALEFLAGFLERADVSHITSPCRFRAPRPPRPRWRSESRRRSTPHPLGPQRSGGWRRRDFLASRGMGEAQGKKVSPTPLRFRRSRRSRPLARSAKERPGVAPNSIL